MGIMARWRAAAAPEAATLNAANQHAERLRDGPVAVPRDVLVDHCDPHAGMAERAISSLEAGTGRSRECAACISEIVKMQVREPDRLWF